MNRALILLQLCSATALGLKVGNALTEQHGQGDKAAKWGNIQVFYNIYNQDETATLEIVKEQLAHVQSSAVAKQIAGLHYVTIGKPFDFPACEECNHLAHYETGGENLILQHLFDHCVANPSDRVFYMHSKGSFHQSKTNGDYRRFLMGMFSEQCLQMQKLSCNTCSSRFSPLPHHHTPGNMWMGECEYIKRLLPPSDFQQKMEVMFKGALNAGVQGIPSRGKKHPDWTVGMNRYSFEHWVHSHPTSQPCDLYDGSFYFGYGSLPTNSTNWSPHLQEAPRFAKAIYNKGNPKMTVDFEHILCWRLYEWKALYGQAPPEGHKWYAYYGGNSSINATCL